MELTNEQIEIINSIGNIKINAVAGSGKTTTIIEYARTRPPQSKILYLAFNKSVKQEAQKKFIDKGINNVKVHTAHSLAFGRMVMGTIYENKVKKTEYRSYEIAEILELRGNGEKHAEYIVANHVQKFLAYFCNSNKKNIQELNYLDIVADSKAKTFVRNFYEYIETATKLLYDKMDKAEIEITHDFYLKKFQLSNPKLRFDYILFDEGQDASPAMLDIFLKQDATKVIVGDAHQQIYAWRFAVNSLEQAEFKSYNLSTSFRFSQDIANLAIEILKWKNNIADFKPIPIIGKGTTKETVTQAVLARTNLGLLQKAIRYVTEKNKVKQIYFEGNINSYTYADDGASLYDVLHLYNNKNAFIKDKLIRQMNDLKELEDYIEKTEDVQLGIMVDIVKEFGNEIPEKIKALKDRHVPNDERENAEIIFSTVHRSKGMEYDAIDLVDDFITEERLIDELEKEGHNIGKLNEEINLLYVAVTRTKNIIHIPSTLMPKDFPASPQIKIRIIKPKEEKENVAATSSTIKKEKAYSVEGARLVNIAAYKPWTQELDEELTEMFCENVSIEIMAKHFGRTVGAIKSRIEKLELEDLYR